MQLCSDCASENECIYSLAGHFIMNITVFWIIDNKTNECAAHFVILLARGKLDVSKFIFVFFKVGINIAVLDLVNDMTICVGIISNCVGLFRLIYINPFSFGVGPSSNVRISVFFNVALSRFLYCYFVLQCHHVFLSVFPVFVLFCFVCWFPSSSSSVLFSEFMCHSFHGPNISNADTFLCFRDIKVLTKVRNELKRPKTI